MSAAISIADLTHMLVEHGAKPGHVRRIYRAWMGKGSWQAKRSEHYPQMLEEFLPQFRSILNGLAHVELVSSNQSETKKLIIGLHDGESVESVLLPREALCISTQVGCAVGCRFCMTGQGGLRRQLGSAEILAQVAAALAVRPQTKKVVMMGMGEPSHNRHAVFDAVEFLGNVLNFDHKKIVISTVGDRRLLDELMALTVRPAIALSLHSTDDERRGWLLTRAPRIPSRELVEMTVNYAEATKYPAQIEWTLIRGLTDGPEEIERLAQWLKGRLAMVNFIAVNPVEGTGFARPEHDHIEDLITILRRNGIVATLRDSAAQDIEGGCGQLRSRYLREKGQ